LAVISKIAAQVLQFRRISQDWNDSEGKGYEDERKEIGNEDLNRFGNGPGPGYSFRRLSGLGRLTGAGFAGCA
jgi:hypothetical protein